ncbi:phage holin family protein [Candidatus Shapirobacteria bacterium]|nr:phage holin family protein [Candidatus Shapirobacteria bacterium]
MGFIRKNLKLFLINFLALWLVGQALAGVEFLGGYQTLALTALVLTLAGFLIKPLVNLLLLPLNLLTLGAFRWLVNVIILWLVTLIVPQFKIHAFVFSGFSYQGFAIPPISLNIFWAYLLTAFFLSLITTFILWLTK